MGVCQDVGIPPFKVSQGIWRNLKFRHFLYQLQIEKTYGDYLKEFKKSKAEQAAKVLDEI